jgi:hypothetical protein
MKKLLVTILLGAAFTLPALAQTESAATLTTTSFEVNGLKANRKRSN